MMSAHVQQAHLVPKAFPANLVKLDLQGPMAFLANVVSQVLLVWQGMKALLVHQGLQVKMVRSAKPELMALQAKKGTQEHLEKQVNQVLPGL